MFSLTRRLLWAAGLASLVACAGGVPPPPTDAPARELSETPFYPQAKYQCGPSALATVLASAGVAVDVDELADQVYVPARKGSLQLELVAAARRRGLLPLQLGNAHDVGAAFDALLSTLSDGYPVLVLQNLGLGFVDVWHYATFIGYLPDTDQVVLRSGRTRRALKSRRAFLRTWRGGQHWALAVVRPGEIPTGVTRSAYLEAVVRLEASGNLPGALAAYSAGLGRWPSEETLLLGRANTLYGLGRKRQASAAYRELLHRDPDNLAAVNNLAQTLLDLGCAREALNVIDERALVDGESFAPLVAQTRGEIVAALQQPGPARCLVH